MAAADAAIAPLAAAKRSDQHPNASKRDRKRQYIVERLATLEEQFSRDKDLRYRDQLQRIQVDMTLVQRIDPYADNALDTLAEMRQEHTRSQGQAPTADNARSLLDMAGPKFQDWAQTVADLHELRDFNLTRQYHEYERKQAEYKNTYNYKVETAKREHQALCSTLRERLINTLTSKKHRLLKEKEALEISDSSALLLHPNQFSLTNPASPGGTHSKRATRLRKDAEELGSLSDSKKRKRNPNEDDGSPAPIRRTLDASTTTPLWQSEKLRMSAKQSGPVYGIDKLFTDKELTLTYNNAAVAAHKYILRHRINGDASSPDGSDSGNGDTNDNEGDGTDSWPSAPAMERQVSHATRSTRGAKENFTEDKILGWEGISSFEVPANLDLIHSHEAPRMPPAQPQQYMKPNLRQIDQNFPVALSQEDITSDLQVINLFKGYDKAKRTGASLDHANGLRRLLQAASVSSASGKYVSYTGGSRTNLAHLQEQMGVTRVSHERKSPGKTSNSSVQEVQTVPTAQLTSSQTGHATVGVAVSMSRQSSLGGVAMSRQGTGGSSRAKGRK